MFESTQPPDWGPRYLPEGFLFSHLTPGTLTSPLGFTKDPDQRTLTYRRAFDRREVPLRVVVAGAGSGELHGTEHHRGTVIEIDGIDPSARGLYQDGTWTVGPGTDQLILDQGHALHWLRGWIHSVTVRTATATVVVIGDMSLGLEDLIRVARSVPILSGS